MVGELVPAEGVPATLPATPLATLGDCAGAEAGAEVPLGVASAGAFGVGVSLGAAAFETNGVVAVIVVALTIGALLTPLGA